MNGSASSLYRFSAPFSRHSYCHSLLPQSPPHCCYYLCPSRLENPKFSLKSKRLIASQNPAFQFNFRFPPTPSAFDSSAAHDDAAATAGDDDDEDGYSDELLFDNEDGGEEEESRTRSVDGVDVQIEKVGKNWRRIRSRVAIESDLRTVWDLLTDYERLSDFIPGLVVSRLVERRDNYARLFQVGRQSLKFGLRFDAKGVMDCYERELESLPNGHRRDIDFKMVEGDFQLFEGKWSIEQKMISCEDSGSLMGEDFQTYLSYIVDVKPKLWLPVRFIEGRLAREIKLNLSCIAEEAKNAVCNSLNS